ncbi:hypothetical protein [Micromonospora carbonacea]|uniref:hypothetical protein n=1 Tax=Micromonospora carbonacea TaxID=47853 RepID=UPI00371931BD
MSAREYRARRWQRWNTRPAQRSLSSRFRRERFTQQQMFHATDVAMEAGEMMGRRFGERDLLRALADDFVLRPDGTPQDLIELAAFIGGKALAEDAERCAHLEATVKRAWEKDPERMRRIADILDDDSLTGEQQKQELEAFAREIGVFPEGPADEREAEERAWWLTPEADDLLDVAEAAGATPGPGAETGDPADAEAMVIDLEEWLRDRGRGRED